MLGAEVPGVGIKGPHEDADLGWMITGGFDPDDGGDDLISGALVLATEDARGDVVFLDFKIYLWAETTGAVVGELASEVNLAAGEPESAIGADRAGDEAGLAVLSLKVEEVVNDGKFACDGRSGFEFGEAAILFENPGGELVPVPGAGGGEKEGVGSALGGEILEVGEGDLDKVFLRSLGVGSGGMVLQPVFRDRMVGKAGIAARVGGFVRSSKEAFLKGGEAVLVLIDVADMKSEEHSTWKWGKEGAGKSAGDVFLAEVGRGEKFPVLDFAEVGV